MQTTTIIAKQLAKQLDKNINADTKSKQESIVANSINSDLEHKQAIESRLSTRLQTLQLSYTSFFEIDADDSSDEEDVDSTKEEYNFEALNKKSSYFPELAHVIGLKIYWSSEVNKLYYKEKVKLLNGNSSDFNECFEKAFSDCFDHFCNSLFNLKTFPSLYRRYTAYFKETFYKERKEIAAIKQNMANLFMANPRILFKIMTLKIESSLLLDLYAPMYDLLILFKRIAKLLKIDYTSNCLIVTPQTLALELAETRGKEIMQLAQQYIQNLGFLDEDNKFVNAGKRRAIHKKQTENNKEKNVFYLKILHLINTKVTTSNMLFNEFLKTNLQSFIEGYCEELIQNSEKKKILEECTMIELDGVQTRAVKKYKIQSKSKFFNGSFFEKTEQEFIALIKEKSDITTIHSLFKDFIACIKNSKFHLLLERQILPNDFTFINTSPLHSLVYARLANRSQSRLIRQKADYSVQMKAPCASEKIFRRVEFPTITASGLEVQEVTSNGVRNDKIINMKKYANIFTQLSKVSQLCKLNDKTIAIMVRRTLANQIIPELNTLIKPKRNELSLFLANFTYVFFITESTRNPACWVIHQMILDLIIDEHLTWKNVLTETKIEKLTLNPYMPMAIPLAVSGARYLAESYFKQAIQPRHYCYAGDADDGVAKANHISGSENIIVELWFKNCIRKTPNTIDEASKIICSSVKSWYTVQLELKPSNPLSYLETWDNTIAFRWKKQLRDTLNASAIKAFANEQKDLIVEYCEEVIGVKSGHWTKLMSNVQT